VCVALVSLAPCASLLKQKNHYFPKDSLSRDFLLYLPFLYRHSMEYQGSFLEILLFNIKTDQFSGIVSPRRT
jgi:hypothetical protein